MIIIQGILFLLNLAFFIAGLYLVSNNCQDETIQIAETIGLPAWEPEKTNQKQNAMNVFSKKLGKHLDIERYFK
ncbi:hypothetical protein MHK_000873 [Candidatus Magnetomorum sp. HK-1]|nr:hypothetical protein MHK_000873 [Candidatus Magnetomorum sp. HK-1]